MALKQASRLLNLKTPLGDDVLLLTGFTGEEGMSQLFRFTLDMISDNASIAAKDIVGKNVTFSIALADDSKRHFNGMVSRFAAGDEDENGRRSYRAEVVPWLWFLTRNSDCRIFQNKSAPEIIEQVFKDRGFTDFKPKLTGSHAKREYCVQFHETDFSFVSRLMEDEGIFYFFEHGDGKHSMILGDKASAYVNSPQKEVDYPTDFGSVAIEDHIRSWEHRYEFRTGKWAHADYNFETPSTDLATNAKTIIDLPGADKFEFYEYPGSYGLKGDGQPRADVRMEEEEAGHDVVDATSLCRAFSPGAKFKVRQHRASSEKGKEFVLTHVRHTANEAMSFETGGEVGAPYQNSFRCIPAAVTFRPARTTTGPSVKGVQTAVVVGPAGEEIFPDKYGRVKVQFHWDRYGKKDENSSCWIRVSQIHAGKSWGGIDVPRIGDEVVVDFVDGDPDRPLIVGRLYHAENMPPYELPANKTQSGLKTHSSPKGSDDNYNELRFEDKTGEEQILVHAERNYDLEVEADETHTVGHNRTKTIENDEITHVKANQDQTVDGNRTMHVVGSFTETIDASESRTVTGGVTETITGDETRTISGSQSETMAGNLSQAIGGSATQTIGGSYAQTVGGSMAVTTSSTYTLTAAGGVKIIAPAGVTVVAPGGQTQVDSFWTQTGGANHTAFASRISVSLSVGQAFALRSAHRGIDSRTTALKNDSVGVLLGRKGTEIDKIAGPKLKNAALIMAKASLHLIT